eukprot:15108442-Alexandrium_andersonii.AAC.1
MVAAYRRQQRDEQFAQPCLQLARELAGKQVVVFGCFDEAHEEAGSFLGAGYAFPSCQKAASAARARGQMHV